MKRKPVITLDVISIFPIRNPHKKFPMKTDGLKINVKENFQLYSKMELDA